MAIHSTDRPGTLPGVEPQKQRLQALQAIFLPGYISIPSTAGTPKNGYFAGLQNSEKDTKTPPGDPRTA